MKIRFIEPGNVPYKMSFKNLYVYDRFIRTPSNGLMTLATIVQNAHPDFDILMYSESISKVTWNDVFDSDIVFISIFTFASIRGYEIADFIRKNSCAKIIFGGLHATLDYGEVLPHCDYVLLGEGDETILKIIDAISKNGGTQHDLAAGSCLARLPPQLRLLLSGRRFRSRNQNSLAAECD